MDHFEVVQAKVNKFGYNNKHFNIWDTAHFWGAVYGLVFPLNKIERVMNEQLC